MSVVRAFAAMVRGEGEVAAPRVIAWGHTAVAFCTPEGLGSKDVEISVRGATLDVTVPRASAATIRFRYAAPRVDAVEPGLVDTEGGETAVVRGANFGVTPRNNTVLDVFLPAGVPLGVTFSFLIAAPMVNEVALGLLFGRLVALGPAKLYHQ